MAEVAEEDQKWRQSAIECQACGYRWQAVYNFDFDIEEFECPACTQFAGRIPTAEEYDKWPGHIFAGDTDDTY